MKILRWAIIGLFLTLIFILYSSGYGDYLTLSTLKEHQEGLAELYQQNPWWLISSFSIAYILATAISFPGATVLTMAAGALFGNVLGTVLVSFASTIGACCSFLLARYIMREIVTKKFGSRLEKINQGIEKDGQSYLFSLRLVPVVPFFLINLGMGLTKIPLRTFFWVSQLGMLPGTFVYVNAGTQLSKIDSLSSIMSGPLLFSFILLGLMPFLSKKALSVYRNHKILKAYPKPQSYDYNLIVIGAGAGGLVSSYIAAALKAKVCLIEKSKMGGDCLNTGCVPSKALLRSAKFIHESQQSEKFGISKSDIKWDFHTVMARVKKIIKKIEPHDSIDRYESLGVECIQGTARLVTPYEVEVNGKILTTKNIILATGAAPIVPRIPGLKDVNYHTSDTIWSLDKLPKRLVVLGGGPIGSELAQAFHRLGSEVTIIEKGDTILGREDQDVSEAVMTKFKQEGIKILSHHTALFFQRRDDNSYSVTCDHFGENAEISFDTVLLALGRKARTTGMGFEAIGIEIKPEGPIQTDSLLRTNIPNIYVCGDALGGYQFTHVAAHEAWFATVNALFSPLKSFAADYRVIPHATYTDPEVARVGLSEKEAKQKNIPYEVTHYGIDDLDRAIADSVDYGFVKVLTAPGRDKILGATIVGSRAGDLLSEFVLAMKHGLGMNKILGTIHIYPTMAEANKFAAGVWRQAHKPEKILELLASFHCWRRGGKKAAPNKPNQASAVEDAA